MNRIAISDPQLSWPAEAYGGRARPRQASGAGAAMAADPARRSERWPVRLVRRVARGALRVPLFYKILVANGAIVAAAATVATVVSGRLAGSAAAAPGETLVVIVAAAIASSILVNFVILRLALEPIRAMEATARRVRAGDMSARVRVSPVADRSLERLSATFNGMLDGLAASRHRLREMATRALTAQEEERRRIARELHDDTGQMLASLLVRLRLLDGADAVQRRELLSEVRSEIGLALEGVRRFARSMRPPALDELGLVPALAAFARELSGAAGIAIELDADEDIAGRLSPETELALYRIVQEALANVARHAGAATARVRLRPAGDHVEVTVSDDGRGFSAAEADRPGAGLGIFGMKERAACVGGTVEVHSRPGSGTRVDVRIPAEIEARYGVAG